MLRCSARSACLLHASCMPLACLLRSSWHSSIAYVIAFAQILAAAAASAELRLVGTPPAPGVAPQGPPVEARAVDFRRLCTPWGREDSALRLRRTAQTRFVRSAGRGWRGLPGCAAACGLGGAKGRQRRQVLFVWQMVAMWKHRCRIVSCTVGEDFSGNALRSDLLQCGWLGAAARLPSFRARILLQASTASMLYLEARVFPDLPEPLLIWPTLYTARPEVEPEDSTVLGAILARLPQRRV